MGEFVTYFQKAAWPASNYYFLLLIERGLATGALLLFSSNAQVALVMCLLIAQIVLVSWLRPYTMVGKQLRPLLNLSISLLIELLFLLLQFLTNADFKFYAPFIILCLLIISISYNLYYYVTATQKRQKELKELNELQQAEMTGE